MTEPRVFTQSEMLAYVPEPCEHCGQNTIEAHFVPITSLAQMTAATWRLGPRKTCRNRNCPTRTGGI